MAKQGAKLAVPRLRFPEFRGADGWKPTPLGKSGTFIRGLTYGAGDVQDDGLLVIRSTNIQDGNLFLDKDLVFVGKKCLPDQTLQAGDVAICMSNGSKALVGKSAEYSGNYAGSITVGAFCSIFRPSLPFAKLAFKSDSYADYVALAIGGGNINNLKNSDLESFAFAIPISPSEQQKIADCLTSLDEVIAAQGRKVEALKAHKRGLMQQLFPREGETRPRLRFPEFRDAPDWGAKGLGELAKIRTGKKDANEGAMDGIYPFFTCAEDHIYSHNYSFDAEAILVAGNANVGQAKYYKGKFEAYQRTYVLTDFAEVFVPYLYEFLAANLRPALLAQVQTSAMSYIRLPMLEEFQVAMPPSIDEQQRIADCLSSLDTQITAESNQLAALKTHKQGLMQQLFPAPEVG